MTAANRRPIVHAQFADYDRATGGFVYNARMCAELAALGWSVTALPLPDGFPAPTAAALERIAVQFESLPDGALVLIDQVCLGPLADLARPHLHRLRWVEIFHHPTVHDLAPGSPERARVDRIERAGLAVADLVLVTSPTTARAVIAGFGVPATRVVTAPPGFERFPAAPARGPAPPFRLLSVGALVPRKGYLALVEALAHWTRARAMHSQSASPTFPTPLRGRCPAGAEGGADASAAPTARAIVAPAISSPTPAWRLHIVGNPDRDPDHVAAITAEIERSGLGDRIHLLGQLSEAALAAEWAAADLYVSASEHEGFGMAIGEAVMRGLPVVTTAAGAVGDWLGPDCATIVPAADARTFGAAIAALLEAPDRLNFMRTAAIAAAAQLPTWPASALIVSDALAD